MNTKLTLRLDDDLIRRAKRHAAATGSSVSQVVAHYFALMDGGEAAGTVPITPRVRALTGVLSGRAVDERDYLEYLEEKYR
jgi:Family of unknown function (DUF6364)